MSFFVELLFVFAFLSLPLVTLGGVLFGIGMAVRNHLTRKDGPDDAKPALDSRRLGSRRRGGVTT